MLVQMHCSKRSFVGSQLISLSSVLKFQTLSDAFVLGRLNLFDESFIMLGYQAEQV